MMIAPEPDTSDERLEELILWTRHSGIPDMNALLLDLRRHREAQRPDEVGDLTDDELQRWLQSVPCARYEPADMQRMAREIVRRRVARLDVDDRHRLNYLRKREQDTIAAIGHLLDDDGRAESAVVIVLLNRLIGEAP